MIAFGDADIVVTGGVEGQLDAVATAGFAMMRALSTRNEAPKGASRPFDKDRDGFVFGEAGALMVLESEEHAKHAERPSTLVSSAPASPPTVTTSSPPIRKVRERLGPCGERSRPPGSPSRHRARQRARDGHPDRRRGRSQGHQRGRGQPRRDLRPKSALGHSIGAVGALEAVLTVLALRDGVIPPTLNLENQDPEIDLDVVKGEPRSGRIDFALNNSFGFGGHNVALAFGRA